MIPFELAGIPNHVGTNKCTAFGYNKETVTYIAKWDMKCSFRGIIVYIRVALLAFMGGLINTKMTVD